MAASKTPPWKRKRPARSKHTKLSEADKKKARARAKKAGRRYPNLVDNMRVAREKKRRK
jgi:hypothetical protein